MFTPQGSCSIKNCCRREPSRSSNPIALFLIGPTLITSIFETLQPSNPFTKPKK